MQPKSTKQYFIYMGVLAALLITSVIVMIWFSLRVPSVPPVIQKSRNLMEERKYDEAIGLLLPVIRDIEQTRGPEDPALIKHFDLLAQIYEATGKYAEAEPLWRRSREIRLKILQDPDHPEVIGSGDKLAMCLSALKKFPEAEALLKKSLAHREKAFEPDDARILPSLNRLAEVYVAAGRFADAEAVAGRAVKLARTTIGLQPPSVADSDRWLGAALAAQGKYDEAIALYTQALPLKKKQLPAASHIPPKQGQVSHADYADLLKEAAAVYRKAGKEKEAKDLETQAEETLHPKPQ
jgi:tetratricopeptide (TPR) repeat protein